MKAIDETNPSATVAYHENNSSERVQAIELDALYRVYLRTLYQREADRNARVYQAKIEASTVDAGGAK